MKYIYSLIFCNSDRPSGVCGRKHDRKRVCFIVCFTLFWFALFLCRLNLSRFLIDSRIIRRWIACMNVLAIFDMNNKISKRNFVSFLS